ncbi:MAG TPA: hypothetical protein VGB74_07255 [Actinoplanes sp.]|jgi:hypothetical protein
MTDQREQNAIPTQPMPPAPGPWADYLAAAQRLDAMRRAASAAAGEQQTAVAAAGQELAVVREQLADQATRLTRDLGVPPGELSPQPADRDVAAQAVAAGPAAALAALEQAHRTVNAADALIVAPAPVARRWRPWARNMLIYGPFAAAVLIVQIALYLVAPPGTVPTYALLCGLSMPVLAFGLGWLTIGFVYGGPEGVDRTPIIGLVACLTPVLLTCMGVGLASFFN